MSGQEPTPNDDDDNDDASISSFDTGSFKNWNGIDDFYADGFVPQPEEEREDEDEEGEAEAGGESSQKFLQFVRRLLTCIVRLRSPLEGKKGKTSPP